MEFKRTKTTEITVYELEANSAIDPRYFKVVWTTNNHNVNNTVDLWEMQLRNEVPKEDWRLIAAAQPVDGIPTTKKSIELLAGVLGIKNF